MLASRVLVPAAGTAVAIALALIPTASAQSIMNLGVLSGAGSSAANGVSGDGSVVVGTSGNWAFRWTPSGGMQRLPSYGDALGYGVSADGTTAVGYGEAPNYTWNGFRWSTSSGLTTFGNFGTTTVATATSSDGGVTVGRYMAGGGAWRGFRFTSSGGFQDLGHSPSYYYSAAFGVSGDGSVIVGGYTDNENVTQAYRLSSGTWQGLGRLAGGSTSTAYGVSTDGSVVVGVSDSQNGQRAFRWTATAGMQSLGTIPGLYNSSATAVSGDGSVIVGSCDNFAFRWHDSAGMLSLQSYLTSRGVDLTGWSALTTANAISAEGSNHPTPIIGSARSLRRDDPMRATPSPVSPMRSSEGFTLEQVGVTGHGLNFLWRESASWSQKRGFCSL